MTTTIDFARSFLTFRIDTLKRPPATASHEPPFTLNNARIQLECRARVTDKQSGLTRTFVLGASCKTERVGVERDVWTEPNADFVPIFSDDGYLHIKTYASVGVDVELYPLGSGRQSDRQTGLIAEAFDNVRIDLVELPGIVLNSAEEIVAATLANDPLVARTIIDSSRYTTILEYPVKTINANERDMIYQTDTGPVLLPDLAAPAESMLARFELAFAAFNRPDWIEFLVRVPTMIDSGEKVYHYAKPLRFDSHNQILRSGP